MSEDGAVVKGQRASAEVLAVLEKRKREIAEELVAKEAELRRLKRRRAARSPAADLKEILLAAEGLYRAVHVAWARADLRERGVEVVKVVPAPKAKVEHKRRAIPSRLPGDPPLVPPTHTMPEGHPGFPEAVALVAQGYAAWRAALGPTRPCAVKDHKFCDLSTCEAASRLAWAREERFCMRRGRGSDFCRLAPDHDGECDPSRVLSNDLLDMLERVAEGEACRFCGEPRHLGEGDGGCDSAKRATFAVKYGVDPKD